MDPAHPVASPVVPGRSSVGLLVAFFAVTFLATWSCFVGAIVLADGSNAPPTAGVRTLILLGTFAPALVALGLTRWTDGDAGVRALLGRLFLGQVRARWYVFAAGYMIAIKLAVARLHRLATGAWPRFGDAPLLFMLAATVISTLVGGQVGEELGWRGYALPRLSARFGLGGASIVLGVLWALWHLPLFYLPGVDTHGQAFAVYLLQVVALSVAIAWLWWRTNGSLLLTMLMHAAINNTKDIVPSIPRAPADPFAVSASLVNGLGVALLWVGAAYFLFQMHRAGRGGEKTSEAVAPVSP